MADVKPKTYINQNDSRDVTLLIKDDQKIPVHQTGLASSKLIFTMNGPDEDPTFPCDKCDKQIPNNGKAKLLHMSRAYNKT